MRVVLPRSHLVSFLGPPAVASRILDRGSSSPSVGITRGDTLPEAHGQGRPRPALTVSAPTAFPWWLGGYSWYSAFPRQCTTRAAVCSFWGKPVAPDRGPGDGGFLVCGWRFAPSVLFPGPGQLGVEGASSLPAPPSCQRYFYVLSFRQAEALTAAGFLDPFRHGSGCALQSAIEEK